VWVCLKGVIIFVYKNEGKQINNNAVKVFESNEG